MKPAHANHPIDPPDCLALYLAEMSEMRQEVQQLRAVLFRLVASDVARHKEDEKIIAAQRDAGVDKFLIALPHETDAAKIARLQGANTILKKLALTTGLLQDRVGNPWLSIHHAADRYGCGDERMRQLAKAGKVVSRRDGGGPIFILTASLDARLRWLGREPNKRDRGTRDPF